MAQVYRRKGGEFLVNTQTSGNQAAPDVAALADGGYVVVWEDFSQIGADNSISGIKGQRFDAAGGKVGGEFLVNTTIASLQTTPTVAALPSGRFVVSWTDFSATGGDTSSLAIRGQMFEANGTKVGGEFLVNTATAGVQAAPAVTELAGGGFVIVWSDSSGVGGDNSGSGIKAQLFDAAAAKVGGEIAVNSTIDGNQDSPTVTALPSGGFAVAWSSSSGSVLGPVTRSIMLQSFDSAGVKVGGEQQASASSPGNLTNPSIAALASGFVVTWARQDNSNPNQTAFEVRAQMYDSAGAKLGGEFVVHTASTGSPTAPDVNALPGGGYIVTWSGPAADPAWGGLSVYGQIFDSAGGRRGAAFEVSTTRGNQSTPAVDVLASGDIVVVWADNSEIGNDTSSSGVEGQILAVSSDPPTDIAISPGTVSETAVENLAVATLSAAGTLGSSFTYELLDDAGGAFRIEGDRLVVADNAKLDFEREPAMTVTVRATDLNGASYSEEVMVAIGDSPIEKRFSAGPEIRVNVDESQLEISSTVIGLASGGFAVLWRQSGDTPELGRNFVRFFDAEGDAESGDVLLGTGNWSDLAIIPLANGGFLTARAAYYDSEGTHSVRVQAWDSAGQKVGSETKVGTTTSHLPNNVDAIPLASGGYLVGWMGEGRAILGQIFNSANAPVGGPVTLAAADFNVMFDLAPTPGGGFVAAWKTGWGSPVKAQFFDSAGSPVGAVVTVPLNDPNAFSLSVVALADGGYMLGWGETVGATGVNDLTFYNFKTQAIGADRLAVGGPVLLAGYNASADVHTQIALAPHPDGGFVATWPVSTDADSRSFNGQLFTAAGARVGSMFESFADAFSSMTILADGAFAASWSDLDGHGPGVAARLYRPADEPGPTSGNDILMGDAGTDVIDGQGGDDQIFGFGEADELSGGAGDDMLDGGAGADTMRGGADDDIYVVDDLGDVVEENAGEGTDEVRTSLANYSLLGSNVENLRAASDTAHEFRGSAGDNVLTGGGGNDFLLLHDGGEDLADGGGGQDVLYFGTGLSAGDVANGGAGRDAIVLQGNVTAVLTDTNLVGIESISLQSGANARFGDTANNFYDFDVTTANGNVAAGQVLIVNASSLRAGEDFVFDGSAETDGRFLVYGGHGVDDLTGGDGVDVFFFEGQRWGPDDHVDGGDGRDALVISAGSGLTRIEFEADSFANIESISVNNHFATDPSQKPSYELVLHNGNVAAGGTLIVNGSSIPLGQVVNIDGRGVHDGKLTLIGGGGHDVILAGDRADLIIGGGGADSLAGGTGADVFRYDAVSDSAVGLSDLIADFQPFIDKIDLSRIDANTLVGGDQAFSWIGVDAFSGVAGQLRIHDSGAYRWIAGDTDGDGNADFAIAFYPSSAPQVQSDFLL